MEERKKRGRPRGKTVFKSTAYPRKKYIKIKRFVTEYLVDLNGMRAFQRCGYGTGNDQADNIQAGKLLNRPDVIQLITEYEAERAKKIEITQEMVLKGLKLIADANIMDLATWDGNNFILKPFSEMTRDQASVISSIQQTRNKYGDIDLKFTMPSVSDKRETLVQLGKHIGMFWEGSKQVDPAEITRNVRQAMKEADGMMG